MMDVWEIQRIVRRRLRWTRIISVVCLIVVTGIVAYAVAAIARGDVW